jgi:formylmethanofuran dehydrogenase subunit E
MWEAHEAKLEKALSERIHCDYCGHAIQEDFYYEINGDMICDSCLERHFYRVITD